MKPAYVYAATVLAVHDGDTFTADIDLGCSIHFHTPIRLLGCNAIELAKPGGVDARDNLALLLPIGSSVVLRTVKADKYGGRYDAQVQLPDGSDLVNVLITTNWAAPYDGTGTTSDHVPPWPRP